MSEESIFEDEPALGETSTIHLPYSWIHMAAGAGTCAILAIVSVLLIWQFNGSRPHDLRVVSQRAHEAVSGFLITHRVPQQAVATTDLNLKKTAQAHYFTFDMDISVPPGLNEKVLESQLEQFLRTQEISVSVSTVNNEGLTLGYGKTQFGQVRFKQQFGSVLPVEKQTTFLGANVASPVVSDTLVTLPTLPEADMSNNIMDVINEEPSSPTETVAQNHSGWSPPTHGVKNTQPVNTPESKNIQLAKNDTTSIIPSSKPTRAKLAIIVDDGGYGGESTDIILSLSNLLTLSILPNTPLGSEIAHKADMLGFEIMLHMPMENLSDTLQHEGQLNVDMTESEIRSLTQNALKQIPQARGVNNHTGSKFTTDPRGMALFLDTVKQESLYFVDSRTTENSRALNMAQAYGIPSQKRDLFLDHDNDIEMIRMRFNEIMDLALEQGEAIAICHFRPKTAAVLSELMTELEIRGIELVHASELVQ